MPELDKRRSKDLTDQRFGRLVVNEFAGYVSIKGIRNAFWACTCDCGNTKELRAMSLLNGGTKSCGCLAVDSHTTHGCSGTPEIKAWLSVKQRCYNKNREAYAKYGGSGILMDDDFKKDFNAFLVEIGEIPNLTDEWSVDRIDNTKGYIKGNIRWASRGQQARNRGKRADNSTGFTGVYWRCEFITTYAIATWTEWLASKPRKKSKLFSVEKYGLLPAFAKACKYREEQIARLNSLGYDYSEDHGK